MSIGERLAAAVKQSGSSIRKFQKAMERTGVGGSSYPAVHRYLAGETTPSVEFLGGAARLLGVRVEWLAFGLGDRTEAEAAARAAAMPSLAQQYVADVEGVLRAKFGAYDDLPPWARAAVWEVLQRYRETEQAALLGIDADDHPDPQGFGVEAALALGTTLAQPLELLQPSGVTTDRLASYTVMMCTAFMQLIPTAEERAGRERTREHELDERMRAAEAWRKAHPEEAKRRRAEERQRAEESRARRRKRRTE